MEETDEISLKEIVKRIREILAYLTRKWKIFCLTIALGCLTGFIYAYFKKPIFNAQSTFVLEEDGKSSLNQYAGLASMVGIDIGGVTNGIFQGDNIIELYKSRLMVEKALLSVANFDGQQQLLIDRYVEFNDLKEDWLHAKMRNNKYQSTRLQDSILGVIVDEINKNVMTVSKPDKKLSIIKVQVKSADELFAKAFNDLIVKTVNDFYIQTKTKKSLQNIEILQHQTDSVRSALNNAISGVAFSIDANPNANSALRVLQVPSQRRQVDAEANKAILSELVKNLEISKVSLRRETPLIQVIDKPVLPLQKRQIGRATGVIVGGLIAGFITVLLLTVRFLSAKYL